MRERLENQQWFTGHLDEGPLACWRSKHAKMEISELLVGIYEAKVLLTPRGTLMEYDELVKLAEQVFGIALPNYRELKRDVFKRSNHVAKFMEQLVFLIEEAQRKRDDR